MKKLTRKIALVIAILLIAVLAFSSCDSELNKFISPNSKIIVNKLGRENVGFHVEITMPVYQGWINMDHAANLILSDRMTLINSGDDPEEAVETAMEAKLLEHFKISRSEFLDEYGDIEKVHFYEDYTLVLTMDEGIFMTAIILDENNVKVSPAFRFEGNIFTILDDGKYIYRVGDELLFNVSKVINLKTAEVKDASSEDIARLAPKNGLEVFFKAEGFVKNAKGLGEYNVFELKHSVLLSEEINGRIYIALTREVDGVEALYGYIFDSESGELLYAVEMKAQKDSGAMFIFAEPVIPTKDGYLDIHR